MSESTKNKTVLPKSVIEQIVTEAETFNRNMEERGYHTGGPGDIEGVYDSRVYLLTCAVRSLLEPEQSEDNMYDTIDLPTRLRRADLRSAVALRSDSILHEAADKIERLHKQIADHKEVCRGEF